MIPIKLTVRNFMPYRDNVPTLDFTGIHVASICGDNGSGKSAIIDAITWALWGETRAKRDDDLIYIGQAEAEVDFEFAVGRQKYRVIRKHSRPKRQHASGQTQLHLQIINDDGFRAIDGDTMSLTQQKIIKEIVHMDYDTFTNSSYLRQGHADEFTTSNPSKRKEVLGNILGLSVYDDLEAKARDTARQRETGKEQSLNSMKDIDIELAQMPACESELQKAQTELVGLDEAIKGSESALVVLRQQKEVLETKRVQLVQLEKNIGERKTQLSQWEAQISQLNARLKEHQALSDRRNEIETAFAEFIDVRNQNESLNKSLTVVNRLQQKKFDLEKVIEREQQTMVKEHALAQRNVEELKKTGQELPRLRTELKQGQQHLEAISQQEETFKQKRLASQELLTQVRSMEADKNRLEREIQEITEKLHLLKTEKGAKCPLCGCELGENGVNHIEAEYNAQRQKKAEEVKKNLVEAQVKHADLKLLVEEVGASEKTLAQEKARSQGRLGACEKEIAQAVEASSKIQEEETRQRELEERLSTKNFALPHQAQLSQVETELARLDYDPQKHEQVRKLYESLQPSEAPKRRLDEADKLIAQEKESLAQYETMVEQTHDALTADEQKKQELVPEVSILLKISGELTQKDSELKNLGLKQKEAQQHVGSIRGRLEYLTQLVVKRKEKEAQFNLTAKEESVYRDLAEAFGKKGVQAIIIETALPEIENEANRLLARMTDGRMSVKMETQKETQKGDVVETLDIKISDELGIRNYEMFSGGEAFRINFSIRIALSRLLARRAGAPLPTLIIDEGFGTQDTVGIEKLKEAITSIQDDFEKIMVITHIEELRDAFPARIDVVKTPEGSMISLS